MLNRRGFTLIELMVVTLVIGILVTLAIPRLSGTKDKAKLASVRTDLRNAMTAEEAYFSTSSSYGSMADLQAASNYSLSSGNTGTVTPAPNGYIAIINNPTISAGLSTCAVQSGAGATPSVDGVILCY
jgi:general secretion pathway protein G